MKEYPHPELSNISDMMVLKHTVFMFPFEERYGSTQCGMKKICKA